MGGFAALLRDREADRPEMGRVWQGLSPVPTAACHTAPGSSVQVVSAQGLLRVCTQALQGKLSPGVVPGWGPWPADATPRVSCLSAGLRFPPSSGLRAPRSEYLRVSLRREPIRQLLILEEPQPRAGGGGEGTESRVWVLLMSDPSCFQPHPNPWIQTQPMLSDSAFRGFMVDSIDGLWLL